MSNDDILDSIDARIAQLQQARKLMGLMALTEALGPKKGYRQSWRRRAHPQTKNAR